MKVIHLKLHRFLRQKITDYLKKKVGDRPFCIISNDCWGGELYKLLERPFNTPFIGLMLMSPCYVKLLQNPNYYLHLPLQFRDSSKYPEMQTIHSGTKFPMAVLGNSEIEIHFMHYKSQEDAGDKWMRRLARIDWEHLYIKYDCGKDYADKNTVDIFINLPYRNKLLFGNANFNYPEIIVIKNYSVDAVQQFRNCFLYFHVIGWLIGKPRFNSSFNKIIGRFFFRYL